MPVHFLPAPPCGSHAPWPPSAADSALPTPRVGWQFESPVLPVSCTRAPSSVAGSQEIVARVREKGTGKVQVAHISYQPVVSSLRALNFIVRVVLCVNLVRLTRSRQLKSMTKRRPVLFY